MPARDSERPWQRGVESRAPAASCARPARANCLSTLRCAARSDGSSPLCHSASFHLHGAPNDPRYVTSWGGTQHQSSLAGLRVCRGRPIGEKQIETVGNVDEPNGGTCSVGQTVLPHDGGFVPRVDDNDPVSIIIVDP